MPKNVLQLQGIIDPTGNEQFEEATPPPREEFVMQEKESKALEVQDSDVRTDYTFARNALYSLIEMNLEMTHLARCAAKETEHPRAFEAFNSLSSNTRETLKELMSMQTHAKNIYKDAKVVQKDVNPEETTTIDLNKTLALNTNDILRKMEEEEEAKAKALEEKDDVDGD